MWSCWKNLKNIQWQYLGFSKNSEGFSTDYFSTDQLQKSAEMCTFWKNFRICQWNQVRIPYGGRICHYQQACALTACSCIKLTLTGCDIKTLLSASPLQFLIWPLLKKPDNYLYMFFFLNCLSPPISAVVGEKTSWAHNSAWSPRHSTSIMYRETACARVCVCVHPCECERERKQV